jgi:catechol 2,3-dioxygenase
LRVRATIGGSAHLGTERTDVVVLRERPGARRYAGTTGLYHLAILFPSRDDLAAALARIESAGWPLQGAADHDVSEAIYLADPERNGIEIYRDRPRDQWNWIGGSVRMGTKPLDLSGLVADATATVPEGTTLGHVHLHVRDLAEAERFWSRAVGLDVTSRYAGHASFLSSGGYHHHLGVNVWAGVGAPAPPDDAAGLDHFTWFVPDAREAAAIVDRVRREGGGEGEAPEGALLRDPSGNRFVVLAA